jgi:hypothetical protein
MGGIARRSAAPLEQRHRPLYEWRRAADESRRYALEDERFEPEWQRSARPLCRVWRAPVKSAEK